MKKQFYIAFILGLFSAAVFGQPLPTNGFVQLNDEKGHVSSEGTLVNGKPNGYWKTFYENGLVKTEGNRKNFLLDSTWKFYNDKGIIITEINYKAGKKNGPRNSYDEKGNLILTENFVDDIKNGLTAEYYENRHIKSQVIFDAGKEQGWAYEFDNDSTIISRFYYKSGFLSIRETINRRDKAGLRQGEWKTFYPDGRVKTEVTYRDDKKNGYYHEYAQSGSMMFTIKYVDDLPVSTVNQSSVKIDNRKQYDAPTKTWFKGTFLEGKPIGLHVEYTDTSTLYKSKVYEDGLIVAEGLTDSLGRYQGPWKEFYPTGEIRSEGNYTDSKRTGKWKFMYRNGKTEQTGDYKNGKPTGNWFWYFESGNLLREETYINGLEDGLSTEYSDSNTVVAKGDYVQGLKQGAWLEYSGDVKMEGNYNDGELTDTWKSYYPNGTLAFQGNYTNGQPSGKHSWYYQNGKLKEEGSFVDGKRHGIWKKLNADGTPFMATEYEYGIEKKFDGVKIKPETMPEDIAD